MLRLSAASTWICCCTCGHLPRCSLLRGLGARAPRLPAGQLHRLLFGLRGQHLGLLVGGHDLLGDGLQLGLGVVRRCCPLAVLRLQVGQALLRHAGGLRPRSGCALPAGSPPARLGQPPCLACSLSLAA
jgi:hypothetical protein